MTTSSDFKDILRVEGVNAKGFGIIPKLVMQDRRLTRDAKAIYAYFRSYAGAGTTAFPSVSKICYDLCFGSDDTYRKHLKLLLQYGYLKIEQERAKTGEIGLDGKKIKAGTFRRNIYSLIEKPEELEPEEEHIVEDIKPIENTTSYPTPKNKGTDENEIKSPYPNYRGTDDRGPDGRGTKSNSLKNNSFNNVVVEETKLKIIHKINELNFKYKYTFSLDDIDSVLNDYNNDFDLINNALEYMLVNEPKSGFKNFVGFLISAKGYKSTTKELNRQYEAPRSNQPQNNSKDKRTKTKFHLENSRYEKYTAEELEKIVLENSRKNIEKYTKNNSQLNEKHIY